MAENKLDLIQELSKERSAALELLERTDRRFCRLAENGSLDTTEKALWEDIRAYLRSVP